MKQYYYKLILTLFFAFVFILPVFSKEEKKTIKETIVVTTSRLPVTASNTGRNIIIINREEIEKSPATNITELLKYVAGVDIRRRGISDVQADVSLRGAGFEQVLIMIDGVKFNNPQTGHHNLDIPLELDVVERIEILKGHGSSIFGANAVGGIINIITRKTVKCKPEISTEYGSFNTKAYSINITLPFKKTNNLFSFKKSVSTGYRTGTDYIKFKIYGKVSYDTDNLKLSFSTGYSNKKFGAYNFYTQNFPNQWENTKGGFINSILSFNRQRYRWKLKLYHILHYDYFILDKNNPLWYRNNHKTKVNGIDYQFSFFTKFGITVLGVNLENDSINSNSLGNHKRETISFFIEHKKDLMSKMYLDTSLYFYHYSNRGLIFLPSVVLNYKINPSMDIYFNAGKSFRVPTYTELYYSSPVNKGNSSLEPERSFEMEIGLKFKTKSYEFNLSLFKRFSEEIIDWIKYRTDGLWIAGNISNINTEGVELSYFHTFNHRLLKSIGLSYFSLNSRFKNNGIITKYILDNIKEQILININTELFFDICQSWRLRYNKRLSGYNYLTIDTALYKKPGKFFEIFLKINNITNKRYIEIGGIPMPGIWFLGGIKLNF